MVHNSLSLLSSALTSSSFPSNCWTTALDCPFSTPRFFPILYRNSEYPKWKLRASPKQQVLIEDNGSAEKFLQNNSIKDFIRFIIRDSKSEEGDDWTSYELQTAVVSYRKNFPWSFLQPFLQVDLVSTIHIGDKEYFATLQKELESYDCVLYEMVASKETLVTRDFAAKKKREGLHIEGFNLLEFIQRQLARVLMLDFQLDCINYEADNWYHADLDTETFESLQLEKGENFFSFAKDMTLKLTETMVQSPSENLGFWRSKLLQASRVLPMPLIGLVIIGKICADVGSPTSEYSFELEAFSKLDFGSALKVSIANKLTSEMFIQLMADAEDDSVIIVERNRAATEVLKKAVMEGHRKIAILYGVGHMPDLGRRLKEEFDLAPSQVQWITAWNIRNQNITSDSLPFLKKMAEVLGWPLNRYQTLALLLYSYILALDLWLWELFFGNTVDWISHVGSDLFHYIDIIKFM